MVDLMDKIEYILHLADELGWTDDEVNDKIQAAIEDEEEAY